MDNEQLQIALAGVAARYHAVLRLAQRALRRSPCRGTAAKAKFRQGTCLEVKLELKQESIVICTRCEALEAINKILEA